MESSWNNTGHALKTGMHRLRDADTFTESGLGALRSSRTRTAYSTVQVRSILSCSGLDHRCANVDADVRSAINLRHNDQWLIDFIVNVCVD